MYHGLTATIDLNAVADNVRALQRAAGSAEVAGVIKSDAYGLGMKEIAATLYACGCRSFYTAHLWEAVEARRAFPDIRVAPLNGIAAGREAETLSHGVTPVIYDLASLERFRNAAQKTGKKIPVILFIDTGINRLGFEAQDWRRLGSEPALLEGLHPAMVMSHLACADEPKHELNKKQLAAFVEAVKLFPNTKKSFANSPSIFLGPEYHFDEVRPGRALSGMRLAGVKQNPLTPALTLQAPILQVRSIDRDGAVGYGATQHVTKGMRLATLAAGYSDGVLRGFGNSDENRAHFFSLGGHKVPVVGRISMELTVIDVSAVPESLAHAGALVEIAGPARDIDAQAESAGTIGYELMTLIGQRVERRYIPLKIDSTEEQRKAS